MQRWKSRAEELEKQAQDRNSHFNTCLATLQCLLAELQEIYRVRGVCAPADDSGISGDSVVENLFADVSRLLQTLAFGADGTMQDADCLAGETCEKSGMPSRAGPRTHLLPCRPRDG